MHRTIYYYGEILRALDLLTSGQHTMGAIARLSEAVIGTGTAIVGLAVTPASGLTVSVAPGQIYQQANFEATAISLLNPDAHVIVKQGISADPQVLSGFAAPIVGGQSINYLIEVQYADQDTGSVLLPYWNAITPSVQYNGPGNNGVSQTTVRKGIVSLQIKAGAAATTGTQTTPAPDAGWTGLSVVTVATGQATIISGNISAYLNPPFIPTTLAGLPGNIQNGAWVTWPDTGAANAYVITPVPAAASLVRGQQWHILIANACSGASTLTVSGLTAPFVRNDGTNFRANDVVTNMEAFATFDGTNFQLAFPSPYAFAGVDTGSGLAYQIGWIQ